MAIDDTRVRTSPVAEAGAGPYNYGFKIFEDGDLHMVVGHADGSETVYTYADSKHTVAGAGEESGGSVTVTDLGIFSGTDTLTLISAVDIDQPSDARGQGAFHPGDDELIFDRTVRKIQQLKEEIERCFKISISSSVPPPTLVWADIEDNLVIDDDAFVVISGELLSAILTSIDSSLQVSNHPTTGGQTLPLKNKVYGVRLPASSDLDAAMITIGSELDDNYDHSQNAIAWNTANQAEIFDATRGNVALEARAAALETTPWLSGHTYNAGKWQDSALGGIPFEYRKVGDTVQLRGNPQAIFAGDALVLTMPAGFRPGAGTLMFSLTDIVGGVNFIFSLASATGQLTVGGVLNGEAFSLDGFSFSVTA